MEPSTVSITVGETVENTALERELRMHMDTWREAANERPMRVLVCGLGGSGKSALVNRLLQLKKDERWAEEGRRIGAATSIVSKYERSTERGMKVCLFDTPGFDDIDMSNEEIIARMEDKTEKKLDLLLYCVSLSGAARVQQSDIQAIKIMTQAFSSDIWKKAMIVLTFANEFEKNVASAAEYKETITQIEESMREVLRNDAYISEDIISEMPIVTAGYTDSVLKYDADECESAGGWSNRLFLKALERVEPAMFPALFEVRYSWKDLVAAMRGVIIGAGFCAGIGAIAGAPFGFVGAAIGATIGTGIGAWIGTVTGVGAGVLVFNLAKTKSILKIRYIKWQLINNRRAVVP